MLFLADYWPIGSASHRAPGRGARWLLALMLCACIVSSPVRASNSLVFCARQPALSAEQKDHVLRFTDTVKQVLQNSGSDVALISRSGLDLDRFNIRYSHAGISLLNSKNTPWSVRQLYYACDDGKAKIFDQGLSGFLLDQEASRPSFVSLVFLPSAEGNRLAQEALNNHAALSVLSPHYSANAYAYSTMYQNCNQWVVEIMARAWGNLSLQGDDDNRASAQTWLRQQQYQPTDIDVKYHLLVWLANFVPLVHNGDHPEQNLSQERYQVSMPTSLEGFVRSRMPQAQRIEMCLGPKQIVIHHGWDTISDDCSPGAQDQVVPVSG
jgi:hypothetical protein